MRVDYDSVRYSLTISFLSKCNIIVVPVHLQAYHVLFDYSKLKHVKVIYKTILPRGNQNPYIDEEQTTQWPKEKVQKDKQ
jgi:hypothetical protein